jgi:hypothetical protein
MAGAAVRAVAKFSQSKGYISDLLVARCQAAPGSWQGVVEKNVQALFKRGFGFDLSAPPGDLKTWLQSPSFQDSAVGKASAVGLGGLSQHIFDALASSIYVNGWVMPAEASSAGVARSEGRRIRLLMDEWHLRNSASSTTEVKAKAMLEFRHSAKVVGRLSAYHIQQAYGLHWVSRVRHQNFMAWKDARKVSEASSGGKFQLAAKAKNVPASGCPCCNSTDVADSFSHYLFSCQHPEIVKVRKQLKVVSRSKAIVNVLARQGKPSAGGRASARLAGSLTPESEASLLIGGSRGQFAVVAGASGGGRPDFVKSLVDLWDYDCEKVVGLEDVLEGIQKDAGNVRALSAFEKKYRLLDAGLVLVATFMQKTLKFRNQSFWKVHSSERGAPRTRRVHSVIGQDPSKQSPKKGKLGLSG